MKKHTLFLFAALAPLTLVSCGENGNTITFAASELPHAKILNEALAPVLKEKGFDIKVTVLDWTQQNAAVARGEYDANYFQHEPYLNSYNADAGEGGALKMVVKAHFEKLCLYASNPQDKTLGNGDSIEIVNDISNIERALLLLKDNGVLSDISKNCYDKDGNFAEFDVNRPNDFVTFADDYSRCTITCIKESALAASLGDYDFGVLPGNTALKGLGDDYASRIVFGETVTEEVLSLRANGVAVRPADATNEKTKAIVEAFADERVSSYIQKTFGESVVYHYENLLK